MARRTNKPGIRPAQSPKSPRRFNEAQARYAFDAHVAMIDQEQRFPQLRDNPAWQMLRADAFEAFTLAFGGEA